MSYTSLYGVPQQGCLETVAEYRNGWGSAPVIWDFIWNKYLRTAKTDARYESYMHPRNNLKVICDLANDGKLLEYERICVQLTFDHCVIRKEDFVRVAECLEGMYWETRDGKHVNHLYAIAGDLRDSSKWPKFIGCCFRHTSVGDEWQVSEADESRKYDISRDEGHWFLDVKQEETP